MTISVKHAFQSAKSDGVDTTVVQPSDWNDEHSITLAINKVLGRATAGTGAVEEISCTSTGRSIIGAADATAAAAVIGAGLTVNSGTGLTGGGDLSTTRTISIADSGVTTAKIADANVTNAKLATNAVTTSNITDANVTPAKLSQPFTIATSQASTYGTAIEWTGLPTWVSRITVMLNGVSTNGTSSYRIQIGTGGSYTVTGYTSNSTRIAGTPEVDSSTSGFILTGTSVNDSTSVFTGVITLTRFSGNTWSSHGILNDPGNANTNSNVSTGFVTLSGALERIKVTTASGNTFDAGNINIAYE